MPIKLQTYEQHPRLAAKPGTQLFADPAEVRRRLDRLGEPHVKDLTAYVCRLRQRRGGGETVPSFDPDLAGRKARILALLESPGPGSLGSTVGSRSKAGSGIISPDNNDPTATNFSHLTVQAGWRRTMYVAWNIVPWYLGDSAKPKDIDEAAPELRKVLKLLPQLRVVVTMGRAAQIGWGMYLRDNKSALVNVQCVHPGPLALIRYPDARLRALASLCVARVVAELA